MRRTLTFCLALLVSGSLFAQERNMAVTTGAAVQPFLFSLSSLTGQSPHWNLNYSGSYGDRVSRAFGFDGLDQHIAVSGYLGHRFSLFANAAVGVAHGGITSAQQAEVMKDLLGGQKFFGPRLGLSLGVSNDWDNVKAIYSRISGSLEMHQWRLGANLRFEKPFADDRDALDFISSVGFQHKVAGALYAGVEAVGQDLEGFWEKDEAEGGAKLLVGPSLNLQPANSKLSFGLSGGPVFYATHSTVIPSDAIREIYGQNGYMVRAMLMFNLQN